MKQNSIEQKQSFKSILSELVERTYNEFKFNPLDNKSPGRSTLNDQINDLNNISIRDCKLASFMIAKKLKDLGYPAVLVTIGLNTHPYILVPKIDECEKLGICLEECSMFKISLHAYDYGIDTFTFMRNCITWGSLMNESVQKHIRAMVHTIDDMGIKSLDEAFLCRINSVEQ